MQPCSWLCCLCIHAKDAADCSLCVSTLHRTVPSCPVLAEHTQRFSKHTCKPLSLDGLGGFSICSGNKSLAGVGSEYMLALTAPQYPTVEEDCREHVTD